jgi:copper homeostasis protein
MILEICTDSIRGACIAQSAGAARIELCAALSEGGLTPSAAIVQKARQALNIKLYVIIRVRGGDFFYSDHEFEVMQADIEYCGQCGCDGVVIGALLPDGSVDKQRCGILVDTAKKYSMGVTFHRAIDRSKNLTLAMEDIISIGCERILTSGGYPSAVEGAEVIKNLVEKAKNRIAIMAGAGLNPENVQALIKNTGVKELHGTLSSFYDGGMIYKAEKFSAQEYLIALPDIQKVTKVKNILNLQSK